MLGALIKGFDSILFGLYWGVAVLALATAQAFHASKVTGRAADDLTARCRAWVAIAIVLILLAFGRDLLPGAFGDVSDDDNSGKPLATYLMLAVIVALPLIAGAIYLFRQAGDAALVALTIILLLIVHLFLRALPIEESSVYFAAAWRGLPLSGGVELVCLIVIALISTNRPRAKTPWINPDTRSHHRRYKRR